MSIEHNPDVRKTGHSGNAPEDMREVPVVEHDRPLADDADRHLENIPDNLQGMPLLPKQRDGEQVPRDRQESRTIIETNTNDPNKGRLRRKLKMIGAGAMALIAGGTAVALGVNNLNDDDPAKAKPEQTTSAPANPTPKASNPEKTPAADPSYNPEDPKTWTAEHVPLTINVDGKVENYGSVKELQNSLILEVADYPDLYENPQPFGEGLLKTVNTYVNSINGDPATPTSLSKYKQEEITNPNYDGYIGKGAALDDFIRPGFEAAIVAPPENGGSGLAGSDNTQEWLTYLNELAHTSAKRAARTGGEYHVNYTLDPSAEKPVDYTSGDPSKKQVHVFMYVNVTDNFDDTDLGTQQNADGGAALEAIEQRQRIDMEVQAQEDGTYKIIGLHVEDLPTNQ